MDTHTATQQGGESAKTRPPKPVVGLGGVAARPKHLEALLQLYCGGAIEEGSEQFPPLHLPFENYHKKTHHTMSTAKRSPPFRAEHVGSLLRPDELVQKRYAVAAGKADAAELKPIEDKAVTEVVKLQKDCGFHAISSGEYTRYVLFLFLQFKDCSIYA